MLQPNEARSQRVTDLPEWKRWVDYQKTKLIPPLRRRMMIWAIGAILIVLMLILSAVTSVFVTWTTVKFLQWIGAL